MNDGNSIEFTWPWSYRYMVTDGFSPGTLGQSLEADLLRLPGITAGWMTNVTLEYPEPPEGRSNFLGNFVFS